MKLDKGLFRVDWKAGWRRHHRREACVVDAQREEVLEKREQAARKRTDGGPDRKMVRATGRRKEAYTSKRFMISAPHSAQRPMLIVYFTIPIKRNSDTERVTRQQISVFGR